MALTDAGPVDVCLRRSSAERGASRTRRARCEWPGEQSCSSRTAATRPIKALPGDYRKILAIVREADGPVQVRAVGERMGLDASVRGKLEPLRAKMTKLADRGRLHKRPDGRFTARAQA
ncbi:hypothetical protein P1P75_10960 [Streptomyces sp. ID05-39B]|uniref:hypothetical protein n=1 Tax=Streptomyces sp. ID05-39B TaxID=3028664 RepID=UPI0029B2654F|nr:hypothetical protein [Streptomyces sp. ID05-39B]MDX3526943.1 hypothetical protein [Streptomyces sp. ID05-39B]